MGRQPTKSVEDKTRSVLAVLRGEISITAAARREAASEVSISGPPGAAPAPDRGADAATATSTNASKAVRNA